MSELPEQIAGELESPIVLGTAAEALERRAHGGWRVLTDGRRYYARAVVVATDPAGASTLAGLEPAPMRGLVTYWFATDEAPTDLDLLVLDPRRSGPVVNTAVMSNVAPDYARPGTHLVQATTLAGSGTASEAEVREHLSRMYLTSTRRWDLVVTHHVAHALPEQRPGVSIRQEVELGDRLFVAGDHRDTASIQGALVSGRRTAVAVARALQ